jgi:hypothetical protein
LDCTGFDLADIRRSGAALIDDCDEGPFRGRVTAEVLRLAQDDKASFFDDRELEV